MSKFHDFLTSLDDLGARPQQDMSHADFTLEGMQMLMDGLGHPECTYPSLHIAGTNGKGSVSAFCSAAFQAQGYRVGRFTSPHLAGAIAGISIDQSPVLSADLEATFEQMLPHLEKRQNWTQFEVVTALMFTQFARAKVDAAVIEVGLGGRLDATNVVTPLVSVIAPIDYDHTSILGSTLAEIATEKAGIIKPGVPVILAPQPEEARASILDVAKEKRAPVIEVGKDIHFKRVSSDLSGQVFDIWITPSTAHSSPHNPLTPNPSPARSLRSGQAPLERGAWQTSKNINENLLSEKSRIKIGLLGMHQVENAATAFTALLAANQCGLKVDDAALANGFAAARWPGRFEVVRKDSPVVLDAAHSPAAAQALRAALDEYFPGQPVILVLGLSADKDLAGIIEPLRQRITRVIATQSTHPRAMPAAELQKEIAALGVTAESEAAPILATQRALELRITNAVILVCGSVFLVEEVRANLAIEHSH